MKVIKHRLTASCGWDPFAWRQPPPTLSPGHLRQSHMRVFGAHMGRQVPDPALPFLPGSGRSAGDQHIQALGALLLLLPTPCFCSCFFCNLSPSLGSQHNEASSPKQQSLPLTYMPGGREIALTALPYTVQSDSPSSSALGPEGTSHFTALVQPPSTF